MLGMILVNKNIYIAKSFHKSVDATTEQLQADVPVTCVDIEHRLTVMSILIGDSQVE